MEYWVWPTDLIEITKPIESEAMLSTPLVHSMAILHKCHYCCRCAWAAVRSQELDADSDLDLDLDSESGVGSGESGPDTISNWLTVELKSLATFLLIWFVVAALVLAKICKNCGKYFPTFSCLLCTFLALQFSSQHFSTSESVLLCLWFITRWYSYIILALINAVVLQAIELLAKYSNCARH